MNHPKSSHRGFLLLLLFACTLSLTKCALLDELTTERGSVTTTSTPVGDRETELRKSIADYAKQQLGSKYKYAGDSPKTGFDCSGLTSYVMREFDISISRSSRAQAQEGKKVVLQDAMPGDLVFFKRSRTGPVFHVALIVKNDRNGVHVVHSTNRGVVQENISQNKYWKPKIHQVRNIVGR